jgi:hypothetical protein
MLPLTRALVVTSFIEEAVVVGSQESTISTMDDRQCRAAPSVEQISWLTTNNNNNKLLMKQETVPHLLWQWSVGSMEVRSQLVN